MQNKVSMSLCTTLGGVIAVLLTAAVMHAIWGLGLSGLGWAGALICFIALMIFQISGFVVGISERGSNSGRTGLVVSIVFIIAAVVGFILFIWPHLDLYGLILILIPVPTILMGVFAGLIAIRLQRKPSLKIWKSLLILWLTPSVWCAVLMSIPIAGNIFKGDGDYKLVARYGTSIPSTLFGPWATLVAKLGDWPNAGEFFSLPVAIVLTIILIGLVAVATRIHNRAIQGLTLITFAPFILIWVLIGIGQMLACTS
jgi:hypothetical protein